MNLTNQVPHKQAQASIDVSIYNLMKQIVHILFPGLLLRHCRFLGNGLFSIPDIESWKRQRRLYDPAFKKG